MKKAVAAVFVTVVVGSLGEACKPTTRPAKDNVVEVTASDYAFQAPAKLAAGRTTFSFVNNGKVRHELNIVRLKTGISVEELLTAARENKTTEPLTEGPVGVLFAAPASRSSANITVQLMPGERYAAICIFRDSATAPRHYDKGMYSLIEVGDAQGVAPLTQRATDTITATEYAFQYHRSMAPGRHTFALRNDGKMKHEFTIVLLKKGVTFEKLREVEKADGDVEALFDGEMGLLWARASRTALGELTFDMLPDREYVIGCFFKDSEKAPEHYALGMFGTIRTSTSPGA